MPEWTGNDRRKDAIDFRIQLLRRLDSIDNESKSMNERIIHLAERVEHTNNNTKAFKLLLEEDVNDLRVAIQGDESKGIVGISQKMAIMLNELTKHIAQDNWALGIMITILLAILGWTVFK